ncbi:MFS transporter [Liquorilactobacillus mali]|uniref:Major facilitator superfamily protein n=1 Tax=Liquorilactobacillus mali KCTC 3596 = DSM 20444 TaxID=1046596 RepID=J1F2L6_9LACO|nr:MFS transporter [Liquorilactobacillus mali]EJE99278.1 major facilitator superfamily protein [Liquorilactobacillus mali KCTC 3596 = DSM 20444]KRN08613.1 major facilitator superfamily protein [Liquorilactobacillus mali KCTC 3596 = DSM 20444]QFQ74389.1 MFS transporter [Liquorilactobacillus mali]
MKIKYHKNIKYSYYYSFFSFFGVTGLWVMYLQHAGLTLFEVGLCESIFHIASFLFEVPSGLLADRFSYKTVLVAGRVVSILSAVIMLLAHSFWFFAFSFILSAFSYNLQSGTIDALMYDSLIENQQTSDFPKIISKTEIIFEVADTFGVVAAGFFVHWHFELTYVIAILVGMLALVSVLFLKEPLKNNQVQTDTVDAVKEAELTIIELIKSSWSILKKEKFLLNLMIYQAVIDLICTSYYYYYQSIMKSNGFSGFMISGIIIISSVMAVLSISVTPRITRCFSQLTILRFLVVPILGLISLMFFRNGIIMLLLFMILRVLSAVVGPLFSNYYNDLIESKQRATLLSVASVIFSAFMIVLFPVIGWLIDQIGFAITFGVIGIAICVITCVKKFLIITK